MASIWAWTTRCGNDAAGPCRLGTSSALGLYPVAGSDLYQLGTPLFERAEMKLGSHRLVIVAENYAPTNSRVKKVWLNDRPLDRTWIRHAEIKQGGVLRFEMGRWRLLLGLCR